MSNLPPDDKKDQFKYGGKLCLENINEKISKFYLVMLQEQKLAQHSQYWISDNVTNSEIY